MACRYHDADINIMDEAKGQKGGIAGVRNREMERSRTKTSLKSVRRLGQAKMLF
jgi:hypothetical protein